MRCREWPRGSPRAARPSRQEAADDGAEATAFSALEIDEDLGHAEQAHRDRHEAEPVGELGEAEAVALDPRIHVHSNEPEQEPKSRHCDGLERAAAGQHDRAHEP